MKEWKKFKKRVKICRKESDRLSKVIGKQVWCEFTFTWVNKRVKRGFQGIDINPYCVNLKTGDYGSERDIFTGRWIRDINIKKILEENKWK